MLLVSFRDWGIGSACKGIWSPCWLTGSGIFIMAEPVAATTGHELVFYGTLGSGNSFRVACYLGEKGIPHEYKHVELANGDHKSEEFTAINPRQEVPVIVHKGTVVYESIAILLYLEEVYAGHGISLMPRDPKLRAQVYCLLGVSDLPTCACA